MEGLQRGVTEGAKIGLVIGLILGAGECSFIKNLDPQAAKYITRHPEVAFGVLGITWAASSAAGAAVGAIVEGFTPAYRLMKRLELNTNFQQFRERAISLRTVLER